jgi:hypothetical protein
VYSFWAGGVYSREREGPTITVFRIGAPQGRDLRHMHRSAYRDREESLHGTTHRKQESEESKLLARKKITGQHFLLWGERKKKKVIHEKYMRWRVIGS